MDGFRDRSSGSELRGERGGECIAPASGVDGLGLVGWIPPGHASGVNGASERAEGDDHNRHAELVGYHLGKVVRARSGSMTPLAKQCAGFDLVWNQDVHLIPWQRGHGLVAMDWGRLNDDLGTVTLGEADGLAEGRHWCLVG